MSGPMWLSDDAKWPTNITTSTSPESQAEEKILKEEEVSVLENGTCVRLDSTICRQCKKIKEKQTIGTTDDRRNREQVMWWVKRAQESVQYTEVFAMDRMQLNLQPNDEGVLECRGRIQKQYPIYLPDCHEFIAKVVSEAHLKTMHGGIRATMTQVRERYWVPRLRRLARKVTKSCNGCYRFQAKAFAAPPPGKLPTDRTEGSEVFEVVGVDIAGPLKYRKSKSQEGKAYLFVYAFSLIRALHIEVLTTMEATEFLGSLKRLIARRSRPKKIYSDNCGTFVAAAKWLRTVMKDEGVGNLLAREGIKWQFNFSRAP